MHVNLVYPVHYVRVGSRVLYRSLRETIVIHREPYRRDYRAGVIGGLKPVTMLPIDLSSYEDYPSSRRPDWLAFGNPASRHPN